MVRPGRSARVGLALISAVLLVTAFAGRMGCRRRARVANAPLRVAAAANLALAFPELGAAFERATGDKVVFSFGASGLLAKQLVEGAPFDVFASADVRHAEDAVRAGVCDGASQTIYARGRLVLWARKGQPPGVPSSLADLADPRYVKIAIANPEHAPYGRAAREALTAAGVYQAVQPRLVFGTNVQQALQFAQSGNAEVAVAAWSLALDAEGGDLVPIDERLHAPLDQALVVCAAGARAPAARRFAAFVSSPEAQRILAKHGFTAPGGRAQEAAR